MPEVLCLYVLFTTAMLARSSLATAATRVLPTSLNFGNQLVGTSSGSQAVTLRNTGTTTITIIKLTVSGDFSQTNTCAGNLAVNTSCTIDVTFTPTAKGLRKGSINIFGDDTLGPQSVHLIGVGTVVKLSVDALSFEGQPIRTSSDPRTVTLTNTGNTPLRIASIRVGRPVQVWGSARVLNSGSSRMDEFTQTNDCGASVAPGASCTIRVTFTPRKVRNAEEWLVISDDGGGSPHHLSLSGIGLR